MLHFHLMFVLPPQALFYFRVGKNSEEWFPNMSFILWNGIVDGIVPFILLWTMVFGMVHVY